MGPISSLRVAWSTRTSLPQAVGEAVGAAMCQARHPVVALIFSAGDWDRAALAQALAAELGSLPWCGCTAAAVFANGRVLTSGLALGVLDAPQASVGIGLAGTQSAHPAAVGGAAVARAIEQLPPLSSHGARRRRAIILLTDTSSSSGTDTVRGAVREGGTAVCWAGGGVGGQGRATGRMSLLANGRAFLDRTVALAIDLPAPFGAGMGHGFRPQGPALTVTRAREDLVEQLEYGPASATYESLARRYGTAVDGHTALSALFHNYPLGIPQADGEYVLSEIVRSIGPGALEVVSSVPEGSAVRLMQSSVAALVEGARAAAAAARAKLRTTPGGALIFDCDGRLLCLGDAFPRELEAISAVLGEGVPLLGCTSYGEIGALGSGFPQFHNKTVQVLALPGEEPLP